MVNVCEGFIGQNGQDDWGIFLLEYSRNPQLTMSGLGTNAPIVSMLHVRTHARKFGLLVQTSADVAQRTIVELWILANSCHSGLADRAVSGGVGHSWKLDGSDSR